MKNATITTRSSLTDAPTATLTLTIHAQAGPLTAKSLISVETGLETLSTRSVTTAISFPMMGAGRTASSCITGTVQPQEERALTPVEMASGQELRFAMTETM